MNAKKLIITSIAVVLMSALATVGILAYKMMEPITNLSSSESQQGSDEQPVSTENQAAIDAFERAQAAIAQNDEARALREAREALEAFEKANQADQANEVRQFIQLIENPAEPVPIENPAGIEAGE